MSRERLNFLFLNAGHFLDHLFMLVFATVAALRLAEEWGMSYAALIPYATPGFIAFGLGSLPAGWIADKWSREGMLVLFFVGIGASSILTALADSPVEIAVGLLAIGAFASIYHPVGLAMVVHGRKKTGVPLAVNGVFGNLGVAAAALLTGTLIDTGGWRSAFILPGAVSIGLGAAYAVFVRGARDSRNAPPDGARSPGGGRRDSLRHRPRDVRARALRHRVHRRGRGPDLPEHHVRAPESVRRTARRTRRLGHRDRGYAFGVFAIAALAQLVVGHLVDRYAVRTVFASVAGLQAVFFALMYELTGMAAVVVATAFTFVVFGQIPINDVLVSRIARSEWRSRVYAVRYVVSFSVMASSLPVIAGIHAGWGFGALFVVMAVAAGGILAAVLMLPPTGSTAGRAVSGRC